MPLEASYDKHHLTFHRYVRDPRRCVAVCSCGWRADGPTQEVYDRATSHDQFQFAPIQEPSNARP